MTKTSTPIENAEVLTEQPTATENTELAKILTESKLELTEAETIKQSYAPFFAQMATIKEEAKKINYDSPTSLDEKIARELRLRMVKIRTGSETVKDERKRIHLLKSNIEQSAWNLIKTTCLLEEETFNQIEKKREIAEAKRKADLKLTRDAEVLEQGLTEYVPAILNLGELSDTEYNNLISGAKMQLSAKREADKQAELARLEKERLEAEENERIRVENEKLKAEQERLKREAETARLEAEAKLTAEREQAEAEARKQKEFADAEAKKMKAESDAKLKAEQEKAEKERLALEETVRIEKAKSDAILKGQQEANDKLQAELKAKSDKEAEEKAKAEKEAKAKAEAEKKAMKAPDKTKVMKMVDDLNCNDVAIYESLKTDEAKKLSAEIREKFVGWQIWARKRINETL